MAASLQRLCQLETNAEVCRRTSRLQYKVTSCAPTPWWVQVLHEEREREREHVGNAASPHKNNYMSLCALFAPKLPSCEMQAKWKKVKRSSSSPKGQQHRDPTLSGIFGRRSRASWGILRGPLISRKHPSHDVIFLSRQKLAKQTPKSSRYLEGGKDPHPQDKIQHLDFTKDTRPLYYKTPPCAFHHKNVRSKAVSVLSKDELGP